MPDQRVGRNRPEVQVNERDWLLLQELPWSHPLDDWPSLGVRTLTIRRGESRHLVLFVERGRHRYAIKELPSELAQHEQAVLAEIARRDIPVVAAVGTVVVAGEPIPAGSVGGVTQYIWDDRGYSITRLAERVIPHSLLYRYPFTEENKRLLWNAVAELLLTLHDHGIFWGDPSLANILIYLSRHRVTAIMADAETTEIYDEPLSDARREQDLEMFIESLEWEAEDIRQARGLSERIITESDASYFRHHYAALRAAQREMNALHGTHPFASQRLLRRLNALGYGVLAAGRRALQVGFTGVEAAVALPTNRWQTVTVRPGWYVERVQELLGIKVPRGYARRIYNLILGHQALLSEERGQPVPLEDAARHWFAFYHQPMIELAQRYLPSGQPTLQTYLAIMDHKWYLSEQRGANVPLEEAAMDYFLSGATTQIPANAESTSETGDR
jgi:hypothetical protein